MGLNIRDVSALCTDSQEVYGYFQPNAGLKITINHKVFFKVKEGS